MDDDQAHAVFEEYAAAVAYVAVETPEGDQSIGSAFHVGDNVWITARHVVEGNHIVEVGTTEDSTANYSQKLEEARREQRGVKFTDRSAHGKYLVVGEPMLHPDKAVDVAALKLDGPYGEFDGARFAYPRAAPTPIVQLGGWLDDWLGTELMLTSVVVMGYPRIPFGASPLLVAMRAEINAVLDRRDERHPYFILSATARPGLSGSLAITVGGDALGVTTDSLVMDHAPAELGYFAVLAVEPIFDCLAHHDITPDAQELPKLLSGELPLDEPDQEA